MQPQTIRTTAQQSQGRNFTTSVFQVSYHLAMSSRWSRIVLMVAISLMATTSCGNDSLTEGDAISFYRWCEDAGHTGCRNAWNLGIEPKVEKGWSPDCAIQWKKDAMNGKNPDPYRCE